MLSFDHDVRVPATSEPTSPYAMRALPDDVAPYKRTPEFTQDTVPAGLVGEHRTKPGVWGKIVVLEGRLRYHILEPAPETVELDPTRHGVVEPEMAHRVEPVGDVRFYVEFHRAADV
jgi:tellurite resistance-related uncharacterized protein